jgi:hypothetical protein
VPELKRELRVWKEVQPLYQRLLKLELLKSEMYRDMDYHSLHPPVRHFFLFCFPFDRMTVQINFDFYQNFF